MSSVILLTVAFAFVVIFVRVNKAVPMLASKRVEELTVARQRMKAIANGRQPKPVAEPANSSVDVQSQSDADSLLQVLHDFGGLATRTSSTVSQMCFDHLISCVQLNFHIFYCPLQPKCVHWTIVPVRSTCNARRGSCPV